MKSCPRSQLICEKSKRSDDEHDDDDASDDVRALRPRFDDLAFH
jgi:hypothetical protein